MMETSIIDGELEAIVEIRERGFDDGFKELTDKNRIRKISDGRLNGAFVQFTIYKDKYRAWLEKSNQWPLPYDCLLAKWFGPEHKAEGMTDNGAQEPQAINMTLAENGSFAGFISGEIVAYELASKLCELNNRPINSDFHTLAEIHYRESIERGLNAGKITPYSPVTYTKLSLGNRNIESAVFSAPEVMDYILSEMPKNKPFAEPVVDDGAAIQSGNQLHKPDNDYLTFRFNLQTQIANGLINESEAKGLQIKFSKEILSILKNTEFLKNVMLIKAKVFECRATQPNDSIIYNQLQQTEINNLQKVSLELLNPIMEHEKYLRCLPDGFNFYLYGQPIKDDYFQNQIEGMEGMKSIDNEACPFVWFGPSPVATIWAEIWEESLIDKQKTDSVADNGAVNQDDIRHSQLYILIWRVYLYLKENKKRMTAQAVWDEIRYRSKEHDKDNIIQEVTADEIFWLSKYENEQKHKRTTFDKTLSVIKKNPPII